MARREGDQRLLGVDGLEVQVGGHPVQGPREDRVDVVRPDRSQVVGVGTAGRLDRDLGVALAEAHQGRLGEELKVQPVAQPQASRQTARSISGRGDRRLDGLEDRRAAGEQGVSGAGELDPVAGALEQAAAESALEAGRWLR